MEGALLTKAAVAFGPALLLLFVFDRLDVFNLIPMRTINLLFSAGIILAGVSLLFNWIVLANSAIGFSAYSRYVAPPIEEALKAAPILAMFLYNRIGFKLDAVIAGFAVGAGFSTLENLWYLSTLSDANLSAWLVRGFGTAVMHGSATALFALISHEMTERQAQSPAAQYRFNALLFAPGLLAAIAVHSLFNHFPHQPVLAMAAMFVLAPATLFLALARSEHATQIWLRADENAHRELLAEIRAGHFADTEIGHELDALAAKLPPARHADVAAYAELKIKLVLRAEELILAAHSGGAVEITPDDRAEFIRLDALQHRLGASMAAAVHTLLGLTRNDLWELSRFRARVAREMMD